MKRENKRGGGQKERKKRGAEREKMNVKKQKVLDVTQNLEFFNSYDRKLLTHPQSNSKRYKVPIIVKRT